MATRDEIADAIAGMAIFVDLARPQLMGVASRFEEAFFPKDARASAQGLFNLMILGLGPLVANMIGPKLIGETFNKGGVIDFRSLFLLPCVAAILAAIILGLFFRPSEKREPIEGAPSPAH